MNNEKIRYAAKINNMHLYEVANLLDVSESALCRHMRQELPDDIQEKIVNVIECAKNSQPYDNSFFRAYLRKVNKSFTGRERTGYSYSKYVSRGLDEAEKRRLEGGWDLSL